jgi:hypothetical protein
MIVFGAKLVPPELGRGAGLTPTKIPAYSWDILAAMECQSCSMPIATVLRADLKGTKGEYVNTNEAAKKTLLGNGNVETLGYKVLSLWPQAEELALPAHLPPTVEKAYRAAETNFGLPDCEDAAAMLYRRAIDVAIREKHPEIKGLLSPRIRELSKLGLLPPQMRDWADQIRLIGNDGAHEPEGVTMDDLKPMRGFTEAFLRYFISIPFEVALRRGEIDESGNPTGTREEE